MIKKKRNTILVLGGTGFIGYHLIKACLKNKWNVYSVSTKPALKIRFLKKVKYIYLDITKKKELNFLANIQWDYVVNLGGYVDHSNKSKVYKSHFIGCKNLIEFFKNRKIKSFIQIGSSSEYGKILSPHSEMQKCKPLTIYGKSKYSATNYLVKNYKKKKFPFTVLRLYQTFGPKQDFNRLIPIVIKNCILNHHFPCSAGNQFRDFVHVNDIVNAIILSIKSKLSKGKIINIGSGNPIKIKTLIKKIRKIIKRGYPEFGKLKMRKDENLMVYPNLVNAKKILSWKPKIAFNKGLEDTIKFYLKNLKTLNDKIL